MNKKFEDLTPEQQVSIKAAGKKMMIKVFFNGVNFAGLVFITNLILFMINLAYLDSSVTLLVATVSVDILLLNMLSRHNREVTDSFKETVKKIIE